ncbi:MAG: hypothetical protein H7831_04460 [Magnetococcus sp. WYHC-3]
MTGSRWTQPEHYAPQYFLAALGNGGLAVSFFIYLMFLVPHPDTPIPTFETLLAAYAQEKPFLQALIVVSVTGMLFFGVRHLLLVGRNLLAYRRFRRHERHAEMVAGNGAVGLMAIPLTLAMTVNVLFALAGSLVPGLWAHVELMFPAAVAAFAAIGLLSLRLFIGYFANHLSGKGFDCDRNNHLSQMLVAFAFAMIGVGFAAPAAMSHSKLVAALAALGAIFFLSAALLLGLVKMVLGFRGMLANGVEKSASMSLLIIIPILTLVGIAVLRLMHGMNHHFGATPAAPGSLFVLTSIIFSVQVFFGVMGAAVMKRMGYMETYVHGEEGHPGSYALICPGVALFVFGMFFVSVGLVKTGVLPAFSVAHFVVLGALALVQFWTIRTLFRLDRKMLR